MVLLAFLSLCVATSGTAVAGITTAKIASILLFEDGALVYVYPEGGVKNPPACHGSNGNCYSFSISRPMGREYLAALLTAQARGATVDFWGKATCIDQSVSETLGYFNVRS